MKYNIIIAILTYIVIILSAIALHTHSANWIGW